MTGITIGLVLFAVLLFLMVIRIPIGIAMFVSGAGGYVYLMGGNWTPLLANLKNLAYARLSNYDLVVIPLFLLMGQFATQGGLSKALFEFASAITSRLRGGVAQRHQHPQDLRKIPTRRSRISDRCLYLFIRADEIHRTHRCRG